MMGVRLRLPTLEVKGAASREKQLENEDLLPVPRSRRTWGFWTFTIFWFSAAGTVTNWTGGGTALSYGLTIWDSLLTGFFGSIILACILLINGRAGSVYHIGFPVYCRSSFGVYGAGWPVLNRIMSAIVWNGVNMVTGGQCVYVMIHSIFPSFSRLPNHMPASSALDSANMIGFFLCCLATSTALFLSIPKWTILIRIKLVVYILASVGMMALTLSRAGDISDLMKAKGSVQGSARAWLLARFTLLTVASSATFASNAADWQRNASKPSDPIFGQLTGFPIQGLLTAICANAVALSSAKVYGEVIWNPVTYLQKILADDYTASTRAACFFIGFGFFYAAFFSSVFENVLPAGNDICSLLPKYLTIKRSFAICMLLTIACNPWYLLGSASIFISFLSSYQIFLFSITGILLTDYYIISKGRLDLARLYTADRAGPYWYTAGCNWRAFVAYGCGVGVNFAGFLWNMGVLDVAVSLQHSFYFAWITSSITAGVVFYLLTRFFPTQVYRANQGTKFREWTQSEVEQFAAAEDIDLSEVVQTTVTPEECGSDNKIDGSDKQDAHIAVLPAL